MHALAATGAELPTRSARYIFDGGSNRGVDGNRLCAKESPDPMASKASYQGRTAEEHRINRGPFASSEDTVLKQR